MRPGDSLKERMAVNGYLLNGYCAMPSPFAVNLYENIQRLKLDVRQIAALHGPRVATMADLRAFIGQRGSTN